MKVAVLGAAGGIGQPLSLLLKLQLPAGTELALYDISPVTPGMAVDVSHIPTAVQVKGFCGADPTPALEGADIVVISAGMARQPGMDRSDLFNINAGIAKTLVEKIAKVCPKACIGIITNPVNTLVPIAAEVLKKEGVYDKRRLFGVTSLDVLRSETFIAELKGQDVSKVRVPVIGGHSGVTILPLLSQAKAEDKLTFSNEEIESLTKRIRNAGTAVVEAKAGGGSATLSMAQAAARLTRAVLKGLNGGEAVECVYVEGDGKYSRFFAQPVRFGRNGVEELLPIGELSAYEQAAIEEMIPTLKADIELGEKFING